MIVSYRFNSLEDFLISTTLTVDGQLDDGWGALFPVKGREIRATVLFSDIRNFSDRTQELDPVETLIFVNNFFAWITAEALKGRNGIVDKYIGDEIMIVFAEEFGSSDPFGEAVQAAYRMAENDALGFGPHVGIASGRVIVGYAGTPLRYNCSVFGAAVALVFCN
jgi:class 3 adenylate cyclase